MDRTDYQILNILQADCRASHLEKMAKDDAEKYNSFCEFCRNDPGIISHYHVIGVFNALLRFAVRGTRELDELLSAIKRYGDSQTSVELKTYFESKDIPMPE